MKRKSLFLMILIALWVPSVYAADQAKKAPETPSANVPQAPEAKEGDEPKLSVTQHSITIGSEVIRYSATAGYLRLRDESEKPKADMFFVAYVREPQDGQPPRPITFVFNGGPGAASVWLHVGAVGPKRISPEEGQRSPAPPFTPVENQYSWLAFTDLVFIDPVGTGFSRPAAEESVKQFYGIKEDIASVGEFIRLYTSRFGRWLSPKFMAGESYGTLRAIGLADYLYENYGLAFNGLVLISLAIDFRMFSFELGNDWPFMAFLPSYTAAAWYHKRLAPELLEDLDRTLAEAELLATHDYLIALTQGDSLPEPDRERMAGQLARYTGLSADFILRKNLRIDRQDFMVELLRDQTLSIGLVDSRLTAPGGPTNFISDPGMTRVVGPYLSVINDYLRRELQFESSLTYIPLSEDANAQWNWGSALGGYVDVLNSLQQSLRRHAYFKVFAACGLFDLDTPYLGSTYSLRHLNLGPDRQDNIAIHRYPGGHMLYADVPSLKKLTEDVAAFMKAAIPATPTSPKGS